MMLALKFLHDQVARVSDKVLLLYKEDNFFKSKLDVVFLDFFKFNNILEQLEIFRDHVPEAKHWTNGSPFNSYPLLHFKCNF